MLNKCLHGYFDKIAIVVVGYNRLPSIIRLLNSVKASEYGSLEIPLVISIDNSGNIDLYDYIISYHWPHGEKYVIIHKEKLGLKNHILACGDLSSHFKAIIVLEDDLYVSPYFYQFVMATVNKYEADDNIGGISLYSPETNGYVGLPFKPLNNGYDVYAMQSVTSWGQCWTKQMWSDFRAWLSENEPIDFDPIDMVESIKHWKKAWSKYYYAYLISCNKYFIYPYISLSTNFGDSGENSQGANTIVQVNLLNGEKTFNLSDFVNLTKYDVYSNLIGLSVHLGISEYELCVDFWGNNNNLKNKRYILSPFKLPFRVIRSFSCQLRPIELNIIYKIPGDSIYLYDLELNSEIKYKKKLTINQIDYYLQGFSKILIFRIVKHYFFYILKLLIYSKYFK